MMFSILFIRRHLMIIELLLSSIIVEKLQAQFLLA